MARRVFYSFHFENDAHRAAQVRSMGFVEGDPKTTPNGWEVVKAGGDAAIKRWIDGEMQGRTCAVVLVGSQTASRKFVKYEITEAWNRGLGVVGIRIHGLKNLAQQTDVAGPNPFSSFTMPDRITNMANVVKCYDPVGLDSKAKYGWIAQYLAAAVEEAIQIRAGYR